MGDKLDALVQAGRQTCHPARTESELAGRQTCRPSHVWLCLKDWAIKNSLVPRGQFFKNS
jgi:hypothetical protein